MNQSELVELAAIKAEMPKKEVDKVYRALRDCIIQAVAEREKVTLVDFGSFEARDRKAREGRNPKTGDKMQIPATKVPAFSAGKQFKEAVSGQ
ncbi:HU family DNA-binding protein [Microcoleus asticus]|uniref:DNA-binding protein HU n=1 Tax=Microcoleus asticus IPMA8 TaxID=2563858 RepID=A0ABX2D791_9CYAN|nr:HU family DNA-binding protein [Microcoleus asticus]NQE38512.1 DNA-binding protein HU [Microcoleus asticus IPMA8]